MLVFKKYIAVGSTSAIFVARKVLLLRSPYSPGRSSGDVAGMDVPENCGGMAFIDSVASSPEKRALAVSDHGGAT